MNAISISVTTADLGRDPRVPPAGWVYLPLPLVGQEPEVECRFNGPPPDGGTHTTRGPSQDVAETLAIVGGYRCIVAMLHPQLGTWGDVRVEPMSTSPLAWVADHLPIQGRTCYWSATLRDRCMDDRLYGYDMLATVRAAGWARDDMEVVSARQPEVVCLPDGPAHHAAVVVPWYKAGERSDIECPVCDLPMHIEANMMGRCVGYACRSCSARLLVEWPTTPPQDKET